VTRNKDRGTFWETRTVKDLESWGVRAKRLKEGGMYDEGDIELIDLGLIVEARWRQAMGPHRALEKARAKAWAAGHGDAVIRWKRTMPTGTGGPRQPVGERTVWIVPDPVMMKLLQLLGTGGLRQATARAMALPARPEDE